MNKQPCTAQHDGQFCLKNRPATPLVHLKADMVILSLIFGLLPVYAQALDDAITKIPEAIYRLARPAVVNVIADNGQRNGAGIVVGKTQKGLAIVLTANDVIAGFEKKLTVRLDSRAEPVKAQLILEKWRTQDIVLIAVRAKTLPLSPTLEYDPSATLNQDDKIAVLGFPGTPFISQNRGRILRRDGNRITFDFAVPEGQSGGPLIDSSGRVVGLALSRGAKRGEGIPINVLEAQLNSWLGKVPLAERWQPHAEPNRWYGWVLGSALIIASGVAVALSGVF